MTQSYAKWYLLTLNSIHFLCNCGSVVWNVDPIAHTVFNFDALRAREADEALMVIQCQCQCPIPLSSPSIELCVLGIDLYTRYPSL